MALLAVGACGEAGPGDAAEETITVAVQNLYVGADLAALLSAESAAEVPAIVAREYARIQANDFPTRAVAIAASIAPHRPHLIGLQEASLFRVQSPGDLLAGNPVVAEEVVLDFLEILLAELRARGVTYRAVARYRGMDVEVPLPTPAGGMDDVRLTDRGVILARADVPTANPRSVHYDTNLMVRMGGEAGRPVELLGGWASVDATVGGQTYRFVTTHLESGDLAPRVQVWQAAQLLEVLASDPVPIILVGDFSSTPDGAMTPTYESVLGAGFVDLWAEARPGEPGFTCCQGADLRNEASVLERRLDFIFYREGLPPGASARGESAPRGEDASGATQVWRIGASPAERTASGLWPSDHAGLVATLGPAPPGGDRRVP